MRIMEKGFVNIAEGKSTQAVLEEISRADINLTQLRKNVNIIREKLKPGIKFIAVVKGNAYGHGLVPIAEELEKCKCDALGVVRLTEAVALKEAGIKIPVIILAPLMPLQSQWIVKHDIIPMVDNEGIIYILYGLEHKADDALLPKGVKPIMPLKSKILKIDKIKANESGGYGDTFIAKRDSNVAVVGIGYGDGISRGWKEILIAGKRVPVVNYFMDGILVDITDIQGDVKEFDEAVIVGKQNDEIITWEEACHNMNVYIDEQFQRITERVPKHYFYEE